MNDRYTYTDGILDGVYLVCTVAACLEDIRDLTRLAYRRVLRSVAAAVKDA
jgi:hypothetical protein